jgi:phosphatidylglycerol:prolipoprotein diacylglycerol transferase
LAGVLAPQFSTGVNVLLKPLFEFDYFGLSIYNIMGAIGLVFALVLLLKKEKRSGISIETEEKVNTSFIVAGLLSLFFANFANWFLYPDLLNYPFIQRVQSAGLSFYYGVFAFFAISALLLRLYKLDFRFWINEIIPSVLIFHAFGRIGCSLAGCCYGVVIDPIHFLGLSIDTFPAREIEALFLFFLFFVFSNIIKKYRLSLYLLIYSIARFFLEFGRGDNRGYLLIGALSPAQVTSIFIWLVLVAYTGIPQIKNKKIKSVREADTTILNSDS